MKQSSIFSSFVYKFVERFAVKAIGVVIGIILARLISPEHFGQLAILSVFINLSQAVIQGGFSASLVQNKDVTDDDYSTVFYLSELVSIGLISILFISAPIISEYYGSSDLIVPLRVYSLSLLFGAFNSVQIAKLQREMRFKSTMICSLIATMLSGVLGVIMAYAGFELWALIGYHFSNVIFVSIAMLVATKWYPRLVFSTIRAKVLFGYGWKLLVSDILCSLYADVRSLVIGKRFSTETLGFYDRGQQIPQIILTTTYTSIQSIMLPAFSRVQDDKSKIKSMVRMSSSFDYLFTVPAMIGLAMVAEPLVTVLYTEKWLSCVDYLQIVCLGMVVRPAVTSGQIAIKAIGRSDVFMKLEIVRRVMLLAILAISIFCFDSVLAVAIGYAIECWVEAIIVAIPVWKLIGYSPIDQLKNVWKIYVAVLCMSIVLLALGCISMNPTHKLVVQICAGVITYFVTCAVLKVDSLKYLLKKVKNVASHKSNLEHQC